MKGHGQCETYRRTRQNDPSVNGRVEAIPGLPERRAVRHRAGSDVGKDTESAVLQPAVKLGRPLVDEVDWAHDDVRPRREIAVRIVAQLRRTYTVVSRM